MSNLVLWIEKIDFFLKNSAITFPCCQISWMLHVYFLVQSWYVRVMESVQEVFGLRITFFGYFQIRRIEIRIRYQHFGLYICSECQSDEKSGFSILQTFRLRMQQLRKASGFHIADKQPPDFALSLGDMIKHMIVRHAMVCNFSLILYILLMLSFFRIFPQKGKLFINRFVVFSK